LKRGVYFLANDQVLHLTIAFFNSFRRYNPNTPLCLIPYNDDCRETVLLKDLYAFEIFGDPSLLRRCDEISRKFHGRINGTYRKLAMWGGLFDEFIYIDVDTIVLRNVDFVYRYLADFAFLTSHSNIPSIRRYVWKESIYKTGLLSAEQIDYSANTGFIASKKGAISSTSIENSLEGAVLLMPHFELHSQEQPFLNYLIVTSGKQYSSLSTLFNSREEDRRIKLEFWAGRKGGRFLEGEFINGEVYFLVHWAGCWQPRRIDAFASLLMRTFAIGKRNSGHDLYLFMPYKKFWMHYRNFNYAARQKLVSRCSEITFRE
jgi:hypothetical protein